MVDIMEHGEHAALFPSAALESCMPGMGALRRVLQEATEDDPVLVGLRLRGRSPTGTVHLLTEEWLPTCGSGLNGWNPQRLVATDAPVSCRRCERIQQPAPPSPGQLSLFELPTDEDELARMLPAPREP